MGISEHACPGYYRHCRIGSHFCQFPGTNAVLLKIIGVCDLGAFGPTDGAAYIRETFGCPVFTVLYLIWLAALWFHLTHGFWR